MLNFVTTLGTVSFSRCPRQLSFEELVDENFLLLSVSSEFMLFLEPGSTSRICRSNCILQDQCRLHLQNPLSKITSCKYIRVFLTPCEKWSKNPSCIILLDKSILVDCDVTQAICTCLEIPLDSPEFLPCTIDIQSINPPNHLRSANTC